MSDDKKRGRPKKDTDQLLLRLDKSIINVLDEVASNKGISRNQLSNNIISDYVSYLTKSK